MSFVNQLATANRHNRDLKLAMAAVVAVALVAMFLMYRSPRHLSLHIAPHPQAGDVVTITDGVGPVPNVNVYGFAYYLWQQVNRWANDGTKDYGQQLFVFQHYLTPACQEQLKADMNRRAAGGELATRTRSVSEIPGQAYTPARVIQESANSWTVLLDMQLTETVRGMAVKDTFIRYPLRVVRYDVDREKNPWGLAIDCFGGNRPERLDAALVNTGQTSTPHLTAAPVPAAVLAPVAPQAVGRAVGQMTSPAASPAASQATAAVAQDTHTNPSAR